MSLDLIKCKIVSQEEANNVYFVDNGIGWHFTKNSRLKRFQRTGILPVIEKRIGRNCMSKDWLNKYNLMISSLWDSVEESDKLDDKLQELKTIFPEELKEKLLDHVGDEGWIDMEEVNGDDWDFLWISW